MRSIDANHFIWGFHPVREAIQARRRKVRFLYLLEQKEGRRHQELLDMASDIGVVCRFVSVQRMNTMIGHDRHQGVVADVSPYPMSSLEEILATSAAQGRDPFLLLLDHVVDPQNLGAIARTAYCVGVDGIILPKKRSAPPSAASIKASAGAMEHLRLAYVTNMANTIKILKKHLVWIVGADRYGTVDLFQSDLAVPLALVIGGEEKGIRPLVKELCDLLVAIPQITGFNSLNASAAAAVLLYESYRQKNAPSSV